MRKLFTCILMVALLVGFSGIAMSPVHGQDKKKKDKVAKKGGASIVIKAGKDGKFRFTIRDGKGKLLAMSGPTGYATEKAAMAVLDELKEAIATAKVTTEKSK